MRRYWRERQPTSMFRGAEFARLTGAMLMLFVLYAVIVRARDESTWRWLARLDGSPSKEQKAGNAEAPPPPVDNATKGEGGRENGEEKEENVGLTDEAPEQVEMARDEFQVVVDGSLGIHREEMAVYGRLVEWVKNQSFAKLQKRSKKGLWYTDLMDAPSRHRGEIVSLDLEIRRAQDVGEKRYEVDLYEAWGVTEESRGRLYDVLVVDYPKEMPVGYNIYAKAKFAGYFFKLQGYEPAGAKPGQKPERAPLLIGRLQWHPTPAAAPPVDTTKEWIFGLGLMAAIGAAMGVRMLYARWIRPKKKSAGQAVSFTSPGEAIPIDEWLDRAEFLDDDNDRKDQNRE